MVTYDNLIKVVRLYPALYNFNHKDYRNVEKKDQIWAKIACRIKSNVKVAKTKWRYIRDSYTRYLKAHKNNTSNRKKWIWADNLKWLNPYLSHSKQSSKITKNIRIKNEKHLEPINENVQPMDASLLEESSVISIPSKTNNNISQVSSSTETPKLSKNVKSITQSSSSVESVVRRLENRITIELDALDTLFLAHAKTIRGFSPKRQIKAKMRIAEVIMDEELANLGELL